MMYRNPFFLLILWAIALPMLFGCEAMMGRGVRPADLAPEVREVLSLVDNQNSGLKTFKGAGKVSLRSGGILQTARAAWIGARPDRFRFGILDISGRPATGMAADGEFIYAVSHAQERFYKARVSDPDLNRIIEIPVKIRSVIQLLTGGAPVRNFRTAEFPADETEERKILILKDGRDRLVEKIWFSRDPFKVHAVEVYDPGKEMIYRAELADYQAAESYLLPFRVTVFDAENWFQLEIDRYWLNPPTPAAAFVLTDPDV